MSIKVCKVSRMSSKPLSMDLYLDYLKERLMNEQKGVVRKYIRKKLKVYSTVINAKPRTDPIRQSRNKAPA